MKSILAETYPEAIQGERMVVVRIFRKRSRCLVSGFKFRRIVIAGVFLGTLSTGIWTTAQETTRNSTSDSTAESERKSIRDNSEFIGLTTTAKITKKFEIYDPHSKKDLQAVKEMGFTQVILDRSNLHREATNTGLNVVLANWWTKETSPDDIKRTIDLAKQVAARRLMGISMMDEPERNSPDTPFQYYVDLYKVLRSQIDRELCNIRLEISHNGPFVTWNEKRYEYFVDLYQAADAMRIMPYPDLFENPLNDVYFMMLRSRKLMKIANRELPLVVILQAWTLPPKSKLPEIDELRVMAYQAMLGGADTVSFFEYNRNVWAQTPGFHEEFSKLMKELKQLSNRFENATIASTMNRDGVLEANLTMSPGEATTILVNTNRRKVNNLEPLAVIVSARTETLLSVPNTQCPFGSP